MTVKIGHASSDENGRAKGGKAGDQTGRELVIQDWYKREWSMVFRAKDSKIAEKIATAMEQACNNNNIGYNQGQRTTLYEHAKKYNFNLSKIAEKCECDCSSLVAVCVNAAGIKVSKDIYTGNQRAALQQTNKFKVLTDLKYLTSPSNLRRGDILLGPGHTAIVVSHHIKVDAAKKFSNEFIGTYKVTANLNLRCGAGTDKHIILVIPKGSEIKCYGYYTKLSQADWLYVQFIDKNLQYSGFVYSKYVIKNN